MTTLDTVDLVDHQDGSTNDVAWKKIPQLGTRPEDVASAVDLRTLDAERRQKWEMSNLIHGQRSL